MLQILREAALAQTKASARKEQVAEEQVGVMCRWFSCCCCVGVGVVAVSIFPFRSFLLVPVRVSMFACLVSVDIRTRRRVGRST